MNDENQHNIPLDVIANGRTFAAVLDAYKRIWRDAADAAAETAARYGDSGDEIFADAMMIAAYRIYLLGVEDGMKGARP